MGKSVELVYTPVRDDGLKGSPRTLVSGPVAPGEQFLCFIYAIHFHRCYNSLKKYFQSFGKVIRIFR